MSITETARSVVEFDHHSPEFARDPWQQYARLRATAPVAWSESHGGFWVVTGYNEVAEAARDDRRFSSASILIPHKSDDLHMIPIEEDLPDSLVYRRLLNPLFGKGVFEAMEPGVRELTDACIDSFIESGRCDLVMDLANAVTAITVLQFLGLPWDDWDGIADAFHTLVFVPQDRPEAMAALAHMGPTVAMMQAAIADRREHPRDDSDVLTYLTRAPFRDRLLTDEEIFGIAWLVLTGGVDTGTSAIGNALLHLHRHPDQRERLRTDPELIPLAVEEFLRYQSPQQALARTAITDCELGDQQIRAGDRLLLVWASAGRDERVFESPDDVVLERFPNRHMAFGVGGHRCLGALLARIEFQVVLEHVLRRIPDYSVVEDSVQEPITAGIVYGKIRMPAVFTPGPRVGDGSLVVPGLPHAPTEAGR